MYERLLRALAKPWKFTLLPALGVFLLAALLGRRGRRLFTSRLFTSRKASPLATITPIVPSADDSAPEAPSTPAPELRAIGTAALVKPERHKPIVLNIELMEGAGIRTRPTPKFGPHHHH